MNRKGFTAGLGSCLALLAIQVPGAWAQADPIPPGDMAVPGELLVRFAPSADAPDRGRLREGADTDLERTLPVPGLQLLSVERGQSVGRAVAEFERTSEVVYAEPNFRRFASVTPNDTYFSRQWSLNNSGQTLFGTPSTPDADIDAPEAWETTTGNPDVTVAVVDSGVDSAHPDLSANSWSNPGESGNGRESNGIDDDNNGLRDDSRGWDWPDADGTPSDLNGHGTHVAGTIAARGNDGAGVAGVNWHARVMPLRVLDADGSGTVADAISAYRYAAAKGAKVVNASLGGGGASRAESDAIAGASGTLFVVAAGNGGDDGVGDDNDSAPEYPCAYPAPNLVCVAASDRSDRLASFSNYGAGSVDLAAPGVDILSTWPGNGFRYLDGTSMAAPHVAGAAALLFGMPTEATGSEAVMAVRSALIGGTEAKAPFGGRTATGGRLNVERSLRLLNVPTQDQLAPPAPAPRPGPAPSPVTSISPTPAPAPAPAAPADTTRPGLQLTVRRRQRLLPVLSRGLGVRVFCSESCRLSARVWLDARTARRVGLTRGRRAVTLGRASRPLTATGTTVRIRLSSQARRKLRRTRGVRVTVRVLARDAAGNSRVMERRIALARG